MQIIKNIDRDFKMSVIRRTNEETVWHWQARISSLTSQISKCQILRVKGKREIISLQFSWAGHCFVCLIFCHGVENMWGVCGHHILLRKYLRNICFSIYQKGTIQSYTLWSGQTFFTYEPQRPHLSNHTYLEDMACGLQLGLFLLLCRSYRDAVIHTGLGSRLCKVFIQLNLQEVTKPKSIKLCH